jgi:hypothetical protein
MAWLNEKLTTNHTGVKMRAISKEKWYPIQIFELEKIEKQLSLHK